MATDTPQKHLLTVDIGQAILWTEQAERNTQSSSLQWKEEKKKHFPMTQTTTTTHEAQVSVVT